MTSASRIALATTGEDDPGTVAAMFAPSAAEGLALLEEHHGADLENETGGRVARSQERSGAGSLREEGDSGRCSPWPAGTMSDWRSLGEAGRDGSWGRNIGLRVRYVVGSSGNQRCNGNPVALSMDWRKGQWSGSSVI